MKLPLPEVIRTYELTYLLPVSFNDSELGKLTDEITAGMKKNGASIISNEPWGKKKVAYRIKHGGSMQTEAYYVHVVFESKSEKAQAIEKTVALQPQVIRHLLVVAEPATQSQPAAKKASNPSTDGEVAE